MKNSKIMAALFFSSLSVLLFEMIQIRVFSYSLTPILAYAGISLAMTGFGIGAMLLSIIPAIGKKNLEKTLAILALAQSLSILLSPMILARRSWEIILTFEKNFLPLLLEILIPSTVPYLFAGLFVAVLFSTGRLKVSRLYLWNLLGSGIGCIFIVIFLVPVGGEKLIILAAAMSAGAGAMLAFHSSRILGAVGCALAVFELSALFFAGSLYPFPPDPVDTIGFNIRRAAEEAEPLPQKEFSEWNVVGKVDVWNLKVERVKVPEELDLRLLSVDSGATTQLIEDPGIPGWGRELFRDTVYGIAYAFKLPPKRVLVVGAGGGIDVQAALHWGASHVDAVEINSSTIRAVTGEYAEFLKWPTLTDKVSVVNADGRGFIKSASEEYDVIQMTGVDTMTVHATGSINMAEDYLYTVDAFEDCLSVLKSNGVFSVLRFGQDHIRLSLIATRALLRHGAEDPGRHIVTFKQNEASGVIVKRSPFTMYELDDLVKYTARRTRSSLSIPHFEKWHFYINDPIDILYAPGRIGGAQFTEFFQIAKTAPNRLDEVSARLSMHVPTDDNPYYIFGDWLRAQDHPMKFREAIIVMKTFWVVILAMAFVMILIPVAIVRRRITSWKPMFFVLPFFFGIGLSFMLVEICVIHVFSIFVASPGASLAVVLTSILLFSGLGAYVSGTVAWSSLTKIVSSTGFLIVWATLILFASNSIFDHLWKFDLSIINRGLITGLMIAPLGFVMGWFFPTGLAAISSHFKSDELIPWAVSINGFASVVGSVIALPLSMWYGFRNLFCVGLVGYAVVAIVAVVFLFRWRGRRAA